jgi:hypothetical protein
LGGIGKRAIKAPESASLNESNYYRVDLEYTQRTSLLIAAETPAEAEALVVDSIDKNVRGFKILKTEEITEEEKDEILEGINQQGRTIN